MMHVFPLLGMVAFVAVGMVWRSWIQRRWYGGSGFALFRSGDWAQHVREALVPVLGGVMGWQAIVSALTPDRIDRVRLLPVSAPLAWCGALVMVASISLMVAAQLDMGASWRVGIDKDVRPGLVVGGLYRYSRNPIYLAMLLMVLGFVLLVPTATALAILAATIAALNWQVRYEERYLRDTYGDAYAAYAAEVGRFVPRLGRLPRPPRLEGTAAAAP